MGLNKIKSFLIIILTKSFTIDLKQRFKFTFSFHSGLDVMMLLEKVNLADKLPKFAENASTFVIAYAIHKIFAPLRISITLGSTPFIVRFLRKKGFLKK